MKFVYIKWVDASYQRGPVTRDELEPKCELETAGIVVQETKDIISIAQDWDDRYKQWRYVQHIPKKMICKKRRLR